MVFQGVGFVDLMNYAFNGFSIETGIAIVDPMLNRGGVTSMMELLGIFMMASVMGAVITSTGILDVIARNVLLKFIKNRVVLVFTTLIYCYVVNFLAAGGQLYRSSLPNKRLKKHLIAWESIVKSYQERWKMPVL